MNEVNVGIQYEKEIAQIDLEIVNSYFKCQASAQHTSQPIKTRAYMANAWKRLTPIDKGQRLRGLL